MNAYYAGYNAALWGVLSWFNPWHAFACPAEHRAWACGHHDAFEDRKPRPQVRLEAEFEVR
jgi:hypothetical protein